MAIQVKSEPVLFTVVIPVYNREKFLPRTIESVLAQTYEHFEIILVDDCSTDKSFEIAMAYAEKDQRIRAVRNPQNRERSYSRNRAMELARGEFLTFLDSDDLMKPSCLQDAYEFVSKHPEYKFFHNRYELRDESGKLLYVYPAPSLKNQHKAIMKGNFCLIGPFLHKEIYSHYRFDENLLVIKSEDYELWIRIMARYRVGRIDKRNVIVIHHEQRSMFAEEAQSLLNRAQYIYNKIISDKDLYSVYKPYLDLFWAHCYLFATHLAIQAGKKTQAMHLLFKAMQKGKLSLLTEKKFYSVLKQFVW
jgi:glycosyltransferase involved in cell wall biosynthesis